MCTLAARLAQHTAYNLGEFAGSGDARRFAPHHKRTHNGARAALFAIDRQNGYEQGGVGFINKFFGAGAGCAHTHVERPVAHKRKAACRLIKLHGRNTEIEHHAVQFGKSGSLRDGFHITKAPLNQRKPRTKDINQSTGIGQRVRVAVKGKNRATRGFQHGARISAGPEGSIQINIAFGGRDGGDNFR